MAVSDTGKLYCWGKNSAGQCAKAGGEDVLTPLLVTQLKDEVVKAVSLSLEAMLADRKLTSCCMNCQIYFIKILRLLLAGTILLL
jgi:alpha-tubulin suppressor-like RCC1 family protein